MNPLIVGGLGFVLLLGLMAIGMPIGFAMGLTGVLGVWYLANLGAALGPLGNVYHTAANFSFSVVPLFVFMGVVAFHAGLSKDLYNAAHKWVGHWPGGLAMATVVACAGFAAICGSSAATTATVGHVVIPEMRARKYAPTLASGCVAAGGTLGILIPPSIAMVLYAMLTEESIGKLLIAGMIPGILLASGFMMAIFIMVKRNPSLAPPSPAATYRERFASLKSIWGIGLVIVMVIGGIYLGLFTANEAAGIGAFLVLGVSLVRRGVTWKSLFASLKETGTTTAMLIAILIGAIIFNNFMALSKIPQELAKFIVSLEMSKYLILAGVILIYIILGCLMDAITMIILTVPIFYPIMVGLGFSGIWFGVMIEQAGITPPVGVNVFILAGVVKDIPLMTIFKGIVPFFIVMIIFMVIMTMFPQLALFLPNTM